MRWIRRGLFAAGGGALAFCGVCYLESATYQALMGGHLAWLVPESARMEAARLEIPRLGMKAAIKEGVDPRTLMLAVGHLPGTALPGEKGNVVLSGHRDTFFRNLRDIRAGDTATISTPETTYVYRVESTSIVAPDRMEVLAATGQPTLTLITCYPFGYIGPAPKRFVVKARQVDIARASSNPVAAPTTPPHPPPSSRRAPSRRSRLRQAS